MPKPKTNLEKELKEKIYDTLLTVFEMAGWSMPMRDLKVKQILVILSSHQQSDLKAQILAGLPKEKKVKWDEPPREMQDTDYRLGEKIGFNQCLKQIIKTL